MNHRSIQPNITWLVVCGLALLIAGVDHRTARADGPARFDSEIAAFEAYDRQNSFPRDAVLFVGSSSIRMWPTAESFPDVALINRGFGGSHVSDVNHYAERIVLKYKPRLIVFYAGDNDIAASKSPDSVAADFQQFVDQVHSRLPDARLIYLPIKPSLARWEMWPQMKAANAMIQKIADVDPMVDYIDTSAPMLGSDGRPRRELFLDDGLHMNPAGYQIWADLLKHELRQAAPTAP